MIGIDIDVFFSSLLSYGGSDVELIYTQKRAHINH